MTRYLLFVLYLTAFSGTVHSTTITGPFIPGSGNWNTVTNGGFESGLTGWSGVFFSRGGGAFIVTDPVIAGASTLALIPNTNGSVAYGATRGVTVTAGQEYILSGFFNTRNITGAQIYLDLNDASFEAQVGASELVKGEDQWQFSWLSFTPDVDIVNVRIIQDGTASIGEDAYFDEVAITLASNFEPAAVVPLPATVWLLASSLIGLVGMRKKYKT